MPINRLTHLALFTALALIVFIIEAQIPPLIPVPGIKLGLANVITLVVLERFGRRDAFLVFLLRVGLGNTQYPANASEPVLHRLKNRQTLHTIQ